MLTTYIPSCTYFGKPRKRIGYLTGLVGEKNLQIYLCQLPFWVTTPIAFFISAKTNYDIVFLKSQYHYLTLSYIIYTQPVGSQRNGTLFAPSTLA